MALRRASYIARIRSTGIGPPPAGAGMLWYIRYIYVFKKQEASQAHHAMASKQGKTILAGESKLNEAAATI